VALRSATEPIDTSTPSGRLIFQILAAFSEYERETIRERTRAGMHRAYRSGRNMGVIPYGYRADEHGRLQVVAEEAELVREVVSKVASGSMLYAEAKRLNDLGIPASGWRYVGGKRRPVPSLSDPSNRFHAGSLAFRSILTQAAEGSFTPGLGASRARLMACPFWSLRSRS
jgi:hypothetical protein